jgi:hypothetical protein
VASSILSFFVPVLVLLGVFGLLGVGAFVVSRRKSRKPVSLPTTPVA